MAPPSSANMREVTSARVAVSTCIAQGRRVCYALVHSAIKTARTDYRLVSPGRPRKSCHSTPGPKLLPLDGAV